MDDAERYNRQSPQEYAVWDAAVIEAWTEKTRKGWHAAFAEEGHPIIAHARRVAGIDPGHWCEALPEQKDAARRFLTDIGALP